MARKPPGPRKSPPGPVRDWHLWTAVGKTVDPLKGRKSADPRKLIEAIETPPPDAPAAARPEPPRFARPALPSRAPLIAASRVPASEKPIEPNLKRRVTSGREPIDSTLDLHGMTQARAQMVLERFILERAARGERTLLVITGKGIKKTGYLQLAQRGVLREMVPLWLNAPDLAPLIAGIEPAHQSHGGGGALYVRLKRRRET
ncbi:Smr/MutS family protein [Pelagibacterium lacus]|nr:Smr/MutS family protein [Pelagibacterium lacus]